MLLTLHAHVEIWASDCDGTIQRTSVVALNTDELHEHALTVHAAIERGEPDGPYWNDFHEIHFKERVLTNFANPYAVTEGYDQTITIRRDGFECHEPNDEGGATYVTVEWCEDSRCDPNARSYRDLRAEAAGY